MYNKQSEVNFMKKRTIMTVLLFILIALLIAQCGGGPAPEQKPAEKPTQQAVSSGTGGTVDAKALFEERCSACHSFKKATSTTRTADEWKGVVGRMVGKGANLSDTEQTAVIDYLAKNFGK
jgi:cytochrome c5